MVRGVRLGEISRLRGRYGMFALLRTKNGNNNTIIIIKMTKKKLLWDPVAWLVNPNTGIRVDGVWLRF
jgi:hypothetical protein